MPTNGGPIEKILYGLNGIPLFTYGMIGITTLVLAYVTLTDIEIENPLNSINPVSEFKNPTEEASELIIPGEVAQNGELPISEGFQTTNGEVPIAEVVAPTNEEVVAPTEEEVVAPMEEGVQTVAVEPIDKNIQSQTQQDIKKQGGKKRTIRNKKKGRKTIRR